MDATGRDQIRGWKEIASYFGRDERTVKRWEKQRALPVRRIPGAGRANVYLLVSDAEAWLAGGNMPAAALDEDHESDTGEPVAPLAAPHAAAHLATSADVGPSLPYVPAEPAGDPEALQTAPPFTPQAGVKLSHRGPLLAFLGLALLVLAAVLVREASFGRADAMFARSLHSRRLANIPQTRANALYFEGIYFQEQRTPASLDHALRAFQEAAAEDPANARAHAGIATTYLLMREYGSMPQKDAYDKAQNAAQQAIALDPNLAEAHAALGFIAFFSSWDPRRATTEFESALHLDPDSALAHHWYGSMLTHQGLYAEALDQLNAAQQLEPTSAAILASRAYALGLSGHRDEAVEQLQPLVATDHDSSSAHRTLAALSLMEPREIPRFLAEIQKFAEMRNDHDTLNRLTLASDAFQHGGEPAMWADMLQNERKLHPSPEQPTYFMVEAQAALGHQDAAIQDMFILAKHRDPDMIGIRIDPLLDPLRHNPSFKRIEAVVGLEPAS